MCLVCPIQRHCLAAASGDPARFPLKTKKAPRPHRHGAVYILRCGNEVALVERPAKGLLGGMAGLPTSAWLETALTPSEAAAAAPVEARWRLVGAIDHVFTHFSLTLDVYQAESSTRAPGMAWRSLAAARAAIPTVFRKALDVRQRLA